jgi:hypothetical protein
MVDTTIVAIPVHEIVDWDSFHTVFSAALGFPEFYGRNLNAWIDCMHSVDDPDSGMTCPAIPSGGMMTLAISDVDHFRRRCPEQYEALAECVAFVNQERVAKGQPPVLALALSGTF